MISSDKKRRERREEEEKKKRKIERERERERYHKETQKYKPTLRLVQLSSNTRRTFMRTPRRFPAK